MNHLLPPKKGERGKMEYYGKKILTQEEFDFEAGHIGDYVEQAVINDAMDILPPVYMAADCLQVGEPCCYAKDPNTGKWEFTYSTFKLVAGEWRNGLWEYCGNCFYGETAVRYTECR